ncbi:MAG: CopG family transcriptional regulator [Candidatus Verstraetearchaeota archaeon]|nr:CopG family transcriptional regulator [Candidatus Verstraetearchaeota archaeon]
MPEELLRRVDELCKRINISRSEFIARVLEERLSAVDECVDYPTVLWKLKVSGFLRVRSPRYPSRRVRCKWVVEEVDES